MDFSDTPASIIYHQLHPWLKGNLVYVDIDFDVHEYQADFEDRLDNMLEVFITGSLQEYISHSLL